MFIERIIKKKAHKVEAILLRFFYNFFIKFFEKKIINKIKINLALRLVKIESASDEMLNDMDEDKRREIIGNEWFKYNQWMRDPVLNECSARVHFQLNREHCIRYSREYFREIEKRVYNEFPEIMKKYYSHNN
jgi:hypothetical protein